MSDRAMIRMRLLEIPLPVRRGWIETDLLNWWENLHRSGDVQLYVDSDDSTQFATVIRLFGDLIGEKASM